MQMRNKLLIYFASFIVLTLLAVSLSTYHIIQDSAIDNDLALLENLARIQTDDIEHELHDGDTQSSLISRLQDANTTNYYLLLLDKDFNILNQQSYVSDNAPAIISHAINDMRSDNRASGKFKYHDNTYIWYQSGIDNAELKVAYIYVTASFVNLYQQKLLKRLIVVGIIIFWIGTWGALIISTIITRRIAEQQKKIEYQASHDMMTGLQNRNYLSAKIDQIIASGKIPSLSVILLGINRFREINNTLGHDFGDLLLKEFSSRLQSELWSDDTIARFGSDQYALLLPLSDHAHWKIVIDKIAKILQVPFTIQDIRITSDVSIGVSIYPNHGSTAAHLLRCAEVAMYSAKKSGLFYEIYETEKDPNNLGRLQMMEELNDAIKKDELELHYQPKVCIESGKLTGCEALLRWNNKVRGRIGPDVFIPLAEQGSLIKHLTEWVLDCAIRHCAEWHQAGSTLTVSVNLSARLLIEDDIVSIVSHKLAQYELQPHFLVLEITESAMMIDPVRARNILEKLVGLGVQLSIDDFGTGYTSISQIQNMPVKEIKIDKSFVMNMLTKAGDATLVKLIIDMGHGMGHHVTAEGIENRDVLEQLKNMGCDTAQGYFLGRPMPVADFNRYLNQVSS